MRIRAADADGLRGFRSINGFHYQLTVDTAAGCRVAVEGGAGRVELNQHAGLAKALRG